MKPIVLCILDGVGYREEREGNAFLTAHTPNYNSLWNKYPHSLLDASGEPVGIPEGQMGNSEVGHTNIGAGRVVKQPMQVVNDSIKNNELENKEELVKLINHVKENNSNIHLIGLLSDGGIHSHINHLFAVMELLKKENINNVYIHPLLDGRDTEKNIALKYLDQLQQKIDDLGIGEIVSVAGRYYTMDRDNRWDRLEKGYNAIVNYNAPKYSSYKDGVEASYKQNKFDEFVEPFILTEKEINDNDGVLLFNFRSDRLREIGTALTNPDFNEIKTKTLSNIKLVTMFPVDKGVISKPIFEIEDIKNDLGEYISNIGLKQLRIAETEKYPHVTYYFDGENDTKLPGKDETLVPSPKVATYDLKPEMSIYEIEDKLLNAMNNYDLVILNYANGDMVGHTGNFDAAVKACEELDICIEKTYQKIQDLGGLLIITADHGNCENMNGKYSTTHTTNKVPLIICKQGITLKDGKLGDIAPTILKLMNIEVPKEMTGDILIEE